MSAYGFRGMVDDIFSTVHTHILCPSLFSLPFRTFIFPPDRGPPSDLRPIPELMRAWTNNHIRCRYLRALGDTIQSRGPLS